MSLARISRHIRGRPALWTGVFTALAATAASATTLRLSQAVLVGWCSGALLFFGLAWRAIRGATVESIRIRAESLDQGSGFIFCVTVFAALASISAIVLDLGHAKQEGGGIVLLLSAATLILSWFFVHTVFAFHYAHLFYVNPKCIVFPGADQPDYVDFIYFAMVIGMTAQVSDVTTGTADMRRLVLVHAIISFFFNTAILALGVNMAAGLVG